MRDTVSRVLFWAPRALGILFALFLVVFALDVFEPGAPAGAVAIALALHLIPTLLLLLLVALAWRHDLVGALGFAGLGVLYVIGMWGRFPWLTYVLMAGPLVLVGALFLAHWLALHHGPSGRTPTLQH